MIATHAVVLAKEGGKPGLFIVDLSADGVSREQLRMMDASRGAAKVSFSNVPAERLGEAGEGITLFDAVNDRAAVLLAFEQVGGADMCLEMGREYALNRFAFGRPIGGYQAIKHKLADMYCKNTLARGNAYYGAWALNTNASELPIAAAGARVSASDAYWNAAKENVQVHGGMGFTWEVDCHLHYRRSQQIGLVAGSARVWKEKLVSRIERRNAA
jgi:alkylation response protein AidB-like acyl-CoA dehydrogenase